MASFSDFRKLIAEYLSGSVDRKVFTKRFAEMFYGIENSDDRAAIELGYVIEAPLAKAICGLISEDELRVALELCVTLPAGTVFSFQEPLPASAPSLYRNASTSTSANVEVEYELAC